MPVAEAQERVSSAEFTYWLALGRIEADERDPKPKRRHPGR